MRDFFRQYRVLLALIALILLGLHIASSALNRGEETGPVGRVVLAIYSPIHRVVSWPFTKTSSIFHRYFALVGLRAENDILRRDNDALLAQVAQLSSIQAENDRLHELLKFRTPTKAAPVYARIIARSTSPEFRTMVIDKGTDDGVNRNMIALAPGGLVGHVHAVAGNAAKILLITDAASVVDAVVQRTRAAGIVKGRSQNMCTFDFLARTEDIENGDLIVTSGIGGIFTAGHPIGRVSIVDREASDMFLVVEITPSVVFENLEEVILLPGAAPPPAIASPLDTGN
ncbi:MAG: rod shape-determining protein MreC [Deltaproteobacteria bacterium]|nr:rod shape-determining protein MreC [Deltaproteobacteria bacterium]